MAARAVVIGRSNIGGKPMAQLLLTASCTVTIAHSRTRDLPALARCAEILVAAVGRSGSVRGDWIKHGSVVIDVGINWVPERNPLRISAIVDARFRLIVDGETASSRVRRGGAQVPGSNVAQASTISLKRVPAKGASGLILGLD